jgi:hypothetical protein
MDDCCCAPPPLDLGRNKKRNIAYRRVLWAVLTINAAMFAVEIIAGLAAGSASLQADSLDFLGDTANYAISLLVVGMALRYRATAALAKGATWPFRRVGYRSSRRTRFTERFKRVRHGHCGHRGADRQCSFLYCFGPTVKARPICDPHGFARNDVLGNIAVLLAAVGVFGTGRMARRNRGCHHGRLAIQGAALVVWQAAGELRVGRLAAAEIKPGHR